MAKDLVVVGIGSSAGGLEALQIMLSNLPEIANCSYIIAQHLSPTHKSMMVELLSRVTDIPVMEIKNGIIIKPKTIYMTPQNTDIAVSNGRIYLKSVEQAFSPKPSVNYFFSSLANDFKERAIGVILSGTGSDGAYGIRSIKAEGGITLAQSPGSAKYDGMPLSAINTGKVDLVVSIDELAQEIANIVSSLGKDIKIDEDERTLQQIFRVLFDAYGVDFSLYKKNTVHRRLERRIAALKLESLQDYYDSAKDDPNEISNLYHDILIGVTSFFRDKEAFDLIKHHIESIVSKKEAGEEIRFWSIGCSTGEEAYSLAIILSEILGEDISRYKIKIFATDIDDESLKIARTGLYAETSLENLDKKMIQRYFSVQKNQFEVKKNLRELVIFSRHNIVSDSPFLRLDLVSCRNMLIYFSQDLQNKFFPLVHYALNDSGILFLGKSESLGAHIDLFSVLDKNEKIFKAQYTGVKEPPKLYNYSTTHKSYDDLKPKKYKNDEELLEEKIVDALGSVLLEKSVVINSSNDMVYVKGKIPYLNHASGKVTNNIFKLVGEDVALDLRSAINEANREKKAQMTPFRSVTLYEDVMKYLRIVVVPVCDDKNDDWFNILFFQDEELRDIRGHIVSSDNESETITKLADELDATKSHLQNVIEELETSYEEMQSLNEELQSSNEELQSSNEELETTNEELQSTNEELQTAYSELRILYDDKDQRAKELESLMQKLKFKTEEFRKQKELTEAIIDTTPVAVTMVDTNGLLLYANRVAQELFEVNKNELLSRSFDAKEWEIVDYAGESIAAERLPFSLIKKTYEPVHNFEHAIKKDGKKAYLSVSGAPLFDAQGVFKGAVFSIENKSGSKALSDDIVYYKNSLDQKVSSSEVGGHTILELSLIDIITSFKNELNQIALMTHSMRESTLVEGMRNIDTKIESIAKTLDEKVHYYTKRVSYEKTSIIEEIEYFCRLFEPVMQEHSIVLTQRLNAGTNLSLQAHRLKNIFYNCFEFIALQAKECESEEDFNVLIENTHLENRYELLFRMSNESLQKERLSERFLAMKAMVQSEGVTLSLAFDEELVLKITFEGDGVL